MVEHLTNQNEHETAFIRSFIVKEKQKRWLQLLANPKRRTAITGRLYHQPDLDPQFMTRVPPAYRHAPNIEAKLRELGAPSECHVISTDTDVDGTLQPLGQVLVQIHGIGDGTVLSCIPGELAYYEGEDPGCRYILRRAQQ